MESSSLTPLCARTTLTGTFVLNDSSAGLALRLAQYRVLPRGIKSLFLQSDAERTLWRHSSSRCSAAKFLMVGGSVKHVCHVRGVTVF